MKHLFFVVSLFFASCLSAQNVPQFKEVPLNTIHPEGWLKEYFIRQKNGLGGHPHVSGYPFNTKMWTEDIQVPEGHLGKKDWPYEQTAYYLDGILRAGYLLQDTTLIQVVKKNIDYVLTHPGKEGILGFKNSDDWSRVVFFRVLMAEYEVTKDQRILDKLTTHFLQKKRLFTKGRALLSIESILWLYGKTNNQNLLVLAEESFSQNTGTQQGGEYSEEDHAEPQSKFLDVLLSDKIPAGHGVSYLEQVKIPSILYLHTGKQKYLDASIHGMEKLEKHHMLVDGCPSSVEHLSGKSISMAHETCDIVDLSWSAGYLLKATKDGRWADVIERAIFNAGMGAINKEFKGHQYYSAPNQPVASTTSSRFNEKLKWGGMAYGRMCYRTGHDTECCTGNVERMMPAYAGRMWMRDEAGESVVKALYGPGTFTTSINNQDVTFVEQTNYPFSEEIKISMKMAKKSKFSFLLRIPQWCTDPEVRLNGKQIEKLKIEKGFVCLNRTFKNGDLLSLNLPMKIKISTWKTDGDGIAIERGPLVYSLPVKAEMIDFPFIGCADAGDFPHKMYLPKGDWNYAISSKDIEFIKSEVKGSYPWDLNAVPVKLKVRAQKVGNWNLDGTKHLNSWPEKIELSDKEEILEFVPLGVSYLRMTILPELKK